MKFPLLSWLVLLILGSLNSCGYMTSPTPIEQLPDWVLSEWKVGQNILIEEFCYNPDSVYGVHPEYFKWEYKDGYVECGGKDANGCFSTPKTIKVNTQTPHVVRHETLHAILYRIDRDNWKKPQHDRSFRGMCE